TWVRGILASEYGVDLDSIEWITFEDPHVAEYRDPAFVKRAPAGKELAQMLLDGEIDAAVVGDKLPDPRLRHLIPDHETAARKWAESHGGVPINHMVVVREQLSRERPDVVREVVRRLHESKRAAGLPEAGWRRAAGWIPSGSESGPAAPCSRSSSTSAGGNSCCRAGSRWTSCSTPRPRR